jgi:hypothetical protein
LIDFTATSENYITLFKFVIFVLHTINLKDFQHNCKENFRLFVCTKRLEKSLLFVDFSLENSGR